MPFRISPRCAEAGRGATGIGWMMARPGRYGIVDRGGSAALAGPAGLNWLRGHAWPLWLERGVDWKRRAFLEHLDLASLECRAPFRRLRVAARQTFVFSKAAAHGVAGAVEAVALGLEFLRGPARLDD